MFFAKVQSRALTSSRDLFTLLLEAYKPFYSLHSWHQNENFKKECSLYHNKKLDYSDAINVRTSKPERLRCAAVLF